MNPAGVSRPLSGVDPLEGQLRRALSRDDHEVPAEVDRAVLAFASRNAPARLRSRRSRRRVAWRAAVACAAAVVALIVWRAWPTGHAIAPGDHDMLQAFRLAQRVEAGEVVDPRWDMDGDGVVDRRDVERVARSAVRLGAEDRS